MLDCVRNNPKVLRSPNCVLILDEMSIEPRVEYSAHTHSIMGFTTIAPTKTDLNTVATNVLVFQISGILANYKFIIGWHLTGKTIDADDLNKFFLELLQALQDAGLNVRCVTSDMGCNNMQLWTFHEIFAHRSTKIALAPPSITAPLGNNYYNYSHYIKQTETSQPIYFVADSTHLFKSLRNMLLTHDFRIPAWAIRKWDIKKGDLVSWKWVTELYGLQQQDLFQMSYKLTSSHITPSNLEKMRVSFAKQIISSDTAATIRTMVACKLMDSRALPTATFFELAERWYKLINNRRPVLAMWKQNPDENNKTKEFLNEFMLLLTQGTYFGILLVHIKGPSRVKVRKIESKNDLKI